MELVNNGENKRQRVEILHHIAKMLDEVTRLRREVDKEAKANRRHKDPDWTQAEKLETKLAELNAYLNPSGVTPSGLFASYRDDQYVLISD